MIFPFMLNSLLTLLLLLPFGPSPAIVGTPPNAEATRIAAGVQDFVNQYRQKKRLQPLQRNAALDALAQEHADRMAAGKVSFSHTGFDNRASRARKATHVSTVGENLYYTTDENEVARETVDGWIHSPHHNENLLGRFRICGIGVAINAKGHYFVVQIYGG